MQLKIFGLYQRLLTIIPALKLNDVDLLIITHGDVLPYFLPKRKVSYCYFPVAAMIKKEFPSKNQTGFWRAYFEPYRIAINALMKKELRSSNKVLTISRFSQNVIKQLFGVDSDILYPPVDVKTFNQAYQCKKREDIVVVLGRITEEKKQDLAIHAISKVENVKLTIVGSTVPATLPYLNYLKNLTHKLNVENKVEFHMNVSLEELLSIVKKAKVFLHLMRGEHFGVALFETSGGSAIITFHH